MRKALSSLFSLFTVVGGHLFNRRLDLGLLFFALLLLAVVVAWAGYPLLFFNKDQGSMFPDNSSLVSMGYTLLAAIGAVLLASSIVSFLTANNASSRPPIGKVGILGGALASLLSMAAVILTGTTGLSYISLSKMSAGSFTTKSKPDSNRYSSRFSRSSYFHKTVRYGGEWVDSSLLKDLPKGEFYISGKISYEGTPTKGVHLFAVFNDHYRSQEITTDQDGVFSIPVAQGEWMLNRINIEKWPDRPNNLSLSVMGGVDKPLSDNRYDSGPAFRSKGVPLQATKTPTPMPELELTIRPNIQLLWPKREGETANIDQHKISWQGITAATKYQLQLHRMERDGTSTSYFPTAWINTENTEIPLSDFPTIPDEPDKKTEYMVRVYAFDQDGKLLTSSGEFVSYTSLVLQGRIITDTSDVQEISKISDLTADEQIQEMELRHRDRQRLKAADTLAEEGLTAAAKTLAERVKAKSLESEKLRTMASILAVEGNCKEAKIKLEAANKSQGKSCFPKAYRERCGKE